MLHIERELGDLSVSIGTSLAIQGFFGEHPNQTPHPPASKQINSVWINVRTLVRNYLTSMTADDARKVTLQQCVGDLIQEIQTINTVFNEYQNGRNKLVVYYADLSEFKWIFPHARHKTPKTEKQVWMNMMESQIFQSVVLQCETVGIDLVRILKRPPPVSQKVALMTHYPHELLWRPLFDLLYLLESHTGKLKGFGDWYSKLNGISKEDNIPFTPLTLQIFGEGQLLDAQPKVIKDEVKQIALTRKWSSITTMEKIKDDIKRYGSTELSKLINTLVVR